MSTPSFLAKSGKHTYGLGRFWSGCAQQARKGLELAGFCCVDLQHWTALHLYARQTVPQEGRACWNSTQACCGSWPQSCLRSAGCCARMPTKHGYVATACGFALVSRLRSDAVLYYLYAGARTGKRGRPRLYDGKVDKRPPARRVRAV